MKPNPLFQEIEIKLWLLGSDPSSLAKRLAQTPVLARSRTSHLSLYNIYFDTPDQQLRQQRVALRLRRIGSQAKPEWLQTLKTGGNDDSALSRRGEWEFPVPGAALTREALTATPWSDIDPQGRLFASLKPCFVTAFERTIWLVRRQGGHVVEVALDIGQIEADGQCAPICELELELKAGQPAALFDIAQQIAHTMAVLPANLSKAERGFLLAQDSLDQAQHAQVPSLTSDLAPLALTQRVLGEMFSQFTANLNALRTSDDPEVVHQTRIGWRRFKSGVRFFNKLLAPSVPPSWDPLEPLLSALGELRDLDVATSHTLPPLSHDYGMGDVRREKTWQTMMLALSQAADLQRQAVRFALHEAAVGASLLATAQWLDKLSAHGNGVTDQKMPVRHWVKRRILRLHKKMEQAYQDAGTPDSWHYVRILAKRLRYAAESLRDLLPKRLAWSCVQRSTLLQSRIGVARDVAQASALVARLELDQGIVEFLRGVAVGSAPANSPDDGLSSNINLAL